RDEEVRLTERGLHRRLATVALATVALATGPVVPAIYGTCTPPDSGTVTVRGGSVSTTISSPAAARTRNRPVASTVDAPIGERTSAPTAAGSSTSPATRRRGGPPLPPTN